MSRRMTLDTVKPRRSLRHRTRLLSPALEAPPSPHSPSLRRYPRPCKTPDLPGLVSHSTASAPPVLIQSP